MTTSIQFKRQKNQNTIKNLNEMDIEDLVFDPSVIQINPTSSVATKDITIYEKATNELIWKEQDCMELHEVLGTSGMVCIPKQSEQEQHIKERENGLCSMLFM